MRSTVKPLGRFASQRTTGRASQSLIDKIGAQYGAISKRLDAIDCVGSLREDKRCDSQVVVDFRTAYAAGQFAAFAEDSGFSEGADFIVDNREDENGVVSVRFLPLTLLNRRSDVAALAASLGGGTSRSALIGVREEAV